MRSRFAENVRAHQPLHLTLESLHDVPFLRGELFEHLLHGDHRGAEQRGELSFVERQDLHEYLAPILGIPHPADEAGPLQPVDHAGDRAGGQAGELGDSAGGERTFRSRGQIESLVISGRQAHLLGNACVPQHGEGAALAAQIGETLEDLGRHGVPWLLCHRPFPPRPHEPVLEAFFFLNILVIVTAL
jgi:hypothetical protein